ncbi:hypothetical protein Calow_1541 [Caldicellulosiruptor owensensis OL]|uniref:Uncharacterized protein n=1 Tax=Caldicellulosiruptor owensensis (strain ATCC 700167 / DSM 13100 / OL) TaxID=632518 RepID=E4Q3D8_CALOW|nr:hypothetical protein [Caldicellulosiruptor owensensis]ADQ05087.1 hypothetical protein Calow_1541 [Caldicellulosiruptor owensensis OL]
MKRMYRFIGVLILILYIVGIFKEQTILGSPTINKDEILKYATFDKSKIRENDTVTKAVYEKNPYFNSILNSRIVKNDSTVTPNYTDPGEGSISITYTPRWSSGILYKDGEKDGIFSTIAEELLSIAEANYYVKVASLIYEVASIAFNLMPQDIAVTGYGKAALYHSYSYYSKIAQVYYSSRKEWVTKVDVERKETYRHALVSFTDKNGFTRTKSYDFIPANGYGPIASEVYSSYYWQDSIMYQEAYLRYLWSKPALVLAWTH